ncbi:MAG TPA: hypothetical protein VJZ76_00705 [Thermoanaerobaculia bacterium]|nr:hypothetical protein [Thermoanaerobaculia bacterium]
MDEDDRDFPLEEWEARIEAAYRRIKEGGLPVPWLPRAMNLTVLRRQVRLVREGVLDPRHPQLSTRAWADTVELGIVLNELEMKAKRREAEEDAQRRAESQRRLQEYNEWWMEVYRFLERMPEAAEQVRSMKRELRKVRGRPKRAKKRRAEG